MHLFKLQVRGILEYCSTGWHSSLTEADCSDIERVQKAALRLIMGKDYQGYKQALEHMKLDSLKERRVKMALTFAKKSLKIDKFSNFFPLNKAKHLMKKRNPDKYVVNGAYTEKYRRSTVPFLQRLLKFPHFFKCPHHFRKYTLLLLLLLFYNLWRHPLMF